MFAVRAVIAGSKVEVQFKLSDEQYPYFQYAQDLITHKECANRVKPFHPNGKNAWRHNTELQMCRLARPLTNVQAQQVRRENT